MSRGGLLPPVFSRLLVWLALGLAVYFGYGKKNSKLGRAQAAKPAAVPVP